MKRPCIYIVNYCHPCCTPLKSITQLSKTESFAIAQKLATNNEDTAFNRFGDDYKEYYPRRMETEKWLYDCFVSLGGKPQTAHPYYFVLQGSDYLYEWFGKGKISKLLLDTISSDDISFTFGDSQSRMYKPDRKDPFLKDSLYEFISLNGNSVEKFLEKMQKAYYYIEAQLWTAKYFERL